MSEYFNQYSLNHPNNPQKVAEGKFNFNKNGITHPVANKILSELRNYLEKISIESKIFESYITSYDISNFLSSDKQIATCGWNRHARIIVKTESNTITIIDPWMKFIPRSLEPELVKANPGINFIMLQRKTKDQVTGEGSCVLCSMARLLTIAVEFGKSSLSFNEICKKTKFGKSSFSFDEICEFGKLSLSFNEICEFGKSSLSFNEICEFGKSSLSLNEICEFGKSSLSLNEICEKQISDINAYLIGRIYRIATGQNF